MSVELDRRDFVGAVLLNAVALAASGTASAQSPAQSPAGQTGLVLGNGSPFSFDGLKTRVRDLAANPYVAPPRPAPEIVSRIDYAIHGSLKYRTDVALFANGPGQFPATFFHLGQYFQKSVRMHVVEGGQAREIIYEPAYFDMPADSIARQLPANAGFAGFRFQESRKGHPSRGGRDGGTLDWRRNDWAAFLGASYFRAIGEDYQYGLSARGLALDPALGSVAEEFPDFTHYYIEAPAENSSTVTVHALLESPSVTGAYRFVMTRAAGVTMEVACQLHVRAEVRRFCIAPLTSMYWFSETIKGAAGDWRPEVHDSDGLALWTGAGERIWRPLNNPPRTVVSAFTDEDPKGFGLMQRDRGFDHYQDGVAYERRPSLWVEPVGGWGRGSVQLIEIPTDDEIHDNIVAAWVPAEPVKAGRSLDLAYKLHWL
ncbi:MAG: glucan biosynthesis protein D, partial [Hyphomicrobiaceae bacterium]